MADDSMKPLAGIEHRVEPRYRHLLHIQIGSLEVTTANVSLHGMQIVCPVMPFRRIQPEVKSGQFGALVALPKAGMATRSSHEALQTVSRTNLLR